MPQFASHDRGTRFGIRPTPKTEIQRSGQTHAKDRNSEMIVQSRHEEIRYIFSAERHMSWHESDIVLNVHERGKDFID